MKDVLSMISTLKRPKLLVRAAKFAAEEYDRAQDLKKLLGQTVKKPAESILRLAELELALNVARETGDPTYRASRHILVLSALIGEARFLAALRRSKELA